MKRVLIFLIALSFVYGDESPLEFDFSAFLNDEMTIEITNLDLEKKEKVLKVFPFTFDAVYKDQFLKTHIRMFANVVLLEKGKVVLTISQKDHKLPPASEVIYYDFLDDQDIALLLPISHHTCKVLPAVYFADMKEEVIARKLVKKTEDQYLFDDGYVLERGTKLLTDENEIKVLSDAGFSLVYTPVSKEPLHIEFQMIATTFAMYSHFVDDGEIKLQAVIKNMEEEEEVTFHLILSKEIRDSLMLDDLECGDTLIFHPFTLRGFEGKETMIPEAMRKRLFFSEVR